MLAINLLACLVLFAHIKHKSGTVVHFKQIHRKINILTGLRNLIVPSAVKTFTLSLAYQPLVSLAPSDAYAPCSCCKHDNRSTEFVFTWRIKLGSSAEVVDKQKILVSILFSASEWSNWWLPGLTRPQQLTDHFTHDTGHRFSGGTKPRPDALFSALLGVPELSVKILVNCMSI